MHKIKVFSSIFNIKRSSWQNLLEGASPFCSYEFLGALEETGCIGEKKGQVPLYFTLWEDGLRACFITFVKSHSYGEYIFDWAWADAFSRYQVPYYPKLCAQIPFTPVTDPKFLIHDYKENYRELLLEHVTSDNGGLALRPRLDLLYLMLHYLKLPYSVLGQYLLALRHDLKVQKTQHLERRQ